MSETGLPAKLHLPGRQRIKLAWKFWDVTVERPMTSVPGLGPALGSLVTALKLVGHGSLSASFSVSRLLH